MKYIFNTLIGVGVFFILGAAGSSDLDSMSFELAAAEIVLGGLMIFISLYGKRQLMRKRGKIIKLREGHFFQGA